MKFTKLFCLIVAAVLLLTACGTNGGAETTAPVQTTAPEETVKTAASAVKLLEQGNPKKIPLMDIVEESSEDWKAWIKVSTAFDPELSVYSSDMVPANTQAIVVTFKVSNMDCGQQTMYWCYQLIGENGTVSVWNDTSPTDQLTVTGDGTYQFVFDATKALGGAIVTVESLQMVFPGLTETTTTTVELLEAKAITDASDIGLFTSGKLE